MRKIAVISDIHSNVWALEAVLEDINRREIDGIINLGDILYGPLAPRETYELLQAHDIITIQGNQDRQIYEATQADIVVNPTLKFIMTELSQDSLEWMENLPKTLSLGDVMLCHGTPESDLIYFLEDVSKGYPSLRSDEELLALLGGVNEKVVLCGHTHIPRAVSLTSKQLIINPGSVGLPAYSDDLPVKHRMETYSNLASYCIIEQDKDGDCLVEHIGLPYPFQEAVTAALSNGRPDWATSLATGRV